MTQALPLIAHIVVVGLICWSVICRARLMDERTLPIIRHQHGLLSAAALASLAVPEEWRAPLLSLGVLAFLGLSSARWRGGAPEGTRRRPPADESLNWPTLDTAALRQVVGGTNQDGDTP